MAGPVFLADPPESYRTVHLDGLTAVFHRRSGMTHIVAPPAPQILEALSDGSASADTLLKRLQRSFAIDGTNEDLRALLEVRLTELEAAGLVSRL